MMMMRELEEKIGYRFHDEELLTLALTHCSYAAEHNVPHNQRLEFLGDAILEHAVSKYLYLHFTDVDEGKLTRLRQVIVSEEPLARGAKAIGLSTYVRLGTGERNSGGALKKSVLSDTLESVFAAVYLDGGFEEAEKVILKVLEDEIRTAKDQPSDYKTALQEYLFRNGTVQVTYKTVNVEGPSHNAVFTVEVSCDGVLLGQGTGTSKKRAEQEAAKNALAVIRPQ